MATGRQHFSPPNSGYLGNQSLRARPVLGCIRWIHPGLVSPSSPLSLYPPGQAQRLAHRSAEGAVLLRWRGRRLEVGTHPQDTRSPRDFAKRLQPRDRTALWGRWACLCGGRDPWVWRGWAQAAGNRKARSGGVGGGAHCRHSLPGPLSPFPPGDPSLLRPQGCDTSPGPQGLRGQGQRLFCLFLSLPPCLFSVGVYR